jgi:predicted CoA-binding protein
MADWRENLAESREGLAAILADIPEPLDMVNIFSRARASRSSRIAD